MTSEWKTKISHSFSVKKKKKKVSDRYYGRKIHPVYAHSNYSCWQRRKKRVEVVWFSVKTCECENGKSTAASTKAGSLCLRETRWWWEAAYKLVYVIQNYGFRMSHVFASDGRLPLVRWRPRFNRLNLSISVVQWNIQEMWPRIKEAMHANQVERQSEGTQDRLHPPVGAAMNDMTHFSFCFMSFFMHQCSISEFWKGSAKIIFSLRSFSSSLSMDEMSSNANTLASEFCK